MKFIFIAVWCLLFLATVSCDDVVFEHFSCKNAESEHTSKFDGTPDPCYYKDCPACAKAWPNADVEVCKLECPDTCAEAGHTCVPEPETGWEGPVAVSLSSPMGWLEDCPTGANPVPDRTYVADPIFSIQCTCTCESQHGSCSLPSTLTASTALCHDPSGTSISFDAPMSWDGACTTQSEIPESAGVKSLTIAPLTMTEGACNITPTSTELPPLRWQKATRSCQLDKLSNQCEEQGQQCVPTIRSSTTFTYCVWRDGDQICPVGYPYSSNVFYEAAKIEKKKLDKRECSPCSCSGKPVGSECTTEVPVYRDSACGTAPFASIPINSGGPSCLERESYPGLLSKSAEPPIYTKGLCSGTSQVTGTVDLDDEAVAVTYCCLSELSAPIDPPGPPPR